ncbi:MAG: YezD family protein [Clostridia bacterium]|nr:YezD family protein [Clostridia bacterium]
MAVEKKKVVANDEQSESKECDLDDIEHVIEAIKSMKYGNITIVVQDSKIVQIDKTEKIRLR